MPHNQLEQNIDQKVGTIGDIGCFSAHPLKNLNVLETLSYLVTNNKKIYEKIKI